MSDDKSSTVSKVFLVLAVLALSALVAWAFWVGFIGLGWFALHSADAVGPVDWHKARWFAVVGMLFSLLISNIRSN